MENAANREADRRPIGTLAGEAGDQDRGTADGLLAQLDAADEALSESCESAVAVESTVVGQFIERAR